MSTAGSDLAALIESGRTYRTATPTREWLRAILLRGPQTIGLRAATISVLAAIKRMEQSTFIGAEHRAWLQIARALGPYREETNPRRVDSESPPGWNGLSSALRDLDEATTLLRAQPQSDIGELAGLSMLASTLSIADVYWTESGGYAEWVTLQETANPRRGAARGSKLAVKSTHDAWSTIFHALESFFLEAAAKGELS